jgi:hypothetical protein
LAAWNRAFHVKAISTLAWIAVVWNISRSSKPSEPWRFVDLRESRASSLTVKS